jgi:hypothetical protein
MATPMRPVPVEVERWVGRRAWLRRGDALVAMVLLWGGLGALLGSDRLETAAAGALGLALAGMAVPALRVRWRPLSGWVGLRVSRDLRPGDRAWYVGTHEARLVMVTARHGSRLVLARPGLAPGEGLSVRRTRVLVLAADHPSSRLSRPAPSSSP